MEWTADLEPGREFGPGGFILPESSEDDARDERMERNEQKAIRCEHPKHRHLHYRRRPIARHRVRVIEGTPLRFYCGACARAAVRQHGKILGEG